MRCGDDGGKEESVSVAVVDSLCCFWRRSFSCETLRPGSFEPGITQSTCSAGELVEDGVIAEVHTTLEVMMDALTAGVEDLRLRLLLDISKEKVLMDSLCITSFRLRGYLFIFCCLKQERFQASRSDSGNHLTPYSL